MVFRMLCRTSPSAPFSNMPSAMLTLSGEMNELSAGSLGRLRNRLKAKSFELLEACRSAAESVRRLGGFSGATAVSSQAAKIKMGGMISVLFLGLMVFGF